MEPTIYLGVRGLPLIGGCADRGYSSDAIPGAKPNVLRLYETVFLVHEPRDQIRTDAVALEGAGTLTSIHCNS